jgi:hypothetical protein
LIARRSPLRSTGEILKVPVVPKTTGTFFPMNTVKNRGMLVLASYLILVGLIGLFHISLGALWFLPPLLAIVAGILIIIGK